jgi:hypothetical protein
MYFKHIASKAVFEALHHAKTHDEWVKACEATIDVQYTTKKEVGDRSVNKSFKAFAKKDESMAAAIKLSEKSIKKGSKSAKSTKKKEMMLLDGFMPTGKSTKCATLRGPDTGRTREDGVVMWEYPPHSGKARDDWKISKVITTKNCKYGKVGTIVKMGQWVSSDPNHKRYGQASEETLKFYLVGAPPSDPPNAVTFADREIDDLTQMLGSVFDDSESKEDVTPPPPPPTPMWTFSDGQTMNLEHAQQAASVCQKFIRSVRFTVHANIFASKQMFTALELRTIDKHKHAPEAVADKMQAFIPKWTEMSEEAQKGLFKKPKSNKHIAFDSATFIVKGGCGPESVMTKRQVRDTVALRFFGIGFLKQAQKKVFSDWEPQELVNISDWLTEANDDDEDPEFG